MDNRLKRAIDNNLSGLRVSGERRQAIWAAIEGGKPVKKKMSLALAVALTILLITAVAFAAVILGGKDVVDQKIQPLGQQNDSLRFTKEEVDEILAFAREHGIELDEVFLRRVREEGGYYKEELAMLFAKDQLGFYPGTWDVADQYWFGQFWNSIDPDVINFNTVPKEGELSQAEIEQRAAQYIQEQTGLDLPVLDKEQYRLERSFTEMRENPWYQKREWRLGFEPLTPDAPYIHVALTPGGEVTDYSDNLAYTNSQLPADRADRLMSYFHRMYANIYGSQDSWTQENWQELRRQLGELNLDPAHTRPDIARILRQGYTPPAGALSREQAIEAAATAVAEQYKLDKQQLLDTTKGKLPVESQAHALFLSTVDSQRWKVSFSREYLAEINALTGEALVVDVYSPGNDYNRPYVLDELLPPEDRAFATPRPTPDPGIDWDNDDSPMDFVKTNTDLAPEWFWRQLQDVGYTAKTASGIYNRLGRDYGENERYWPVLYQALHHLRNYGREIRPGDTFPGLPKDSDLKQDAAVQLALDAAKDAALKEGKAVPEGLKAIVFFTFNLYEPGSRTWQVDLVNLGEPPVEVFPETDFAYVKIDAITGEVIEVALPGISGEELPVSRALDLSGPWSDLGEDGRPLIWGNPVAPETFWATMAERYGDRETVARAIMEWTESLGEDSNLWPVEQRAAATLWLNHQHVTEESLAHLSILGLPQAEHIQQPQAEALAWEALKAAAGAMYTEEDYSSARLKAGFFYDAAYPNGCAWQFEFMDSRTEFDTTIGDVTIDGVTGEVLFVNAGTGHG